MPKHVVRRPEHDSNRSLGWLAIEWMEHFLEYGTGEVTGEPIVLGDDTAAFVVDCYAYDERGRRVYDSAFFSAPKGTDKSGLAARFALFEALGPCRILKDSSGRPQFAEGGEVYRDPWGLGFVYEYQEGEPIGAHCVNPRVSLASVGSDQVAENVYASVLHNLRDGILSDALDNPNDVGQESVRLPRNGPNRGGFIKPVTSGSKTKDGGLQTFVAFDETHLFTEREVKDMYQTFRRNLQKRRDTGAWYLETTTMYGVGDQSVAEVTYKNAENVASGKAPKSRMLVHHRYGDITEEQLGDVKIRDKALRDAFGEALIDNGGWRDIEDLHEFCLDPQNPMPDLLRYQFNTQAETSNQWILAREWRARGLWLDDGTRDPDKIDIPEPSPGDAITLGFDGSRGKDTDNGVYMADATAIIATRFSDGLQWVVASWLHPKGVRKWSVPVDEVDAVIAQTFDEYNVVAFYADPARWDNQIDKWEAKYGSQLQHKRSMAAPIKFWMTGAMRSTTSRNLAAYRSAIIEGELTHVNDPLLTEHVLNARAVERQGSVQITKPRPDAKIDLAVAAMLSWSARKAAMAAGITPQDKPKKKRPGRVKRIR